MITTSNFAKSAKHPDAVAISRRVTRFYKGRRYVALAPPAWLLKAKGPVLCDREYRKQLDSLHTKQVAEELGPNAIVLSMQLGKSSGPA
jgi:hypothetical protein